MSRLNTLEEMVRAILKDNPKARGDDRVLTLEVWCKVFGVNPWSPVSEVMRNKELPSQESIGRVRRKIQEKDTTLRGSKKKETVRMAAQVDFIEYSNSDRCESII